MKEKAKEVANVQWEQIKEIKFVWSYANMVPKSMIALNTNTTKTASKNKFHAA